MYIHSEEKLELFYPKVFVEINGNLPGSPIIIPTLFHATHYEEMTRICVEKQAVFKGSKKQWRDTDNPDKASYLVDHIHNSRERVYPSDDKSLPGNLVWFGTARDEGEVYGPCLFEFNYKRVLQAYQVSRGVDHKICYRVGGTLVYQKEISHAVIVCCTTDDCYKLFPLIEEDKTTTKFFTLSGYSNLPVIRISEYPYRDRHEHVIFAFYLPDGNVCLKLANEVRYSELTQISHDYCVKSKGNCKFIVDPSDIDEEIDTKWNQLRSK